MTDGGLKDRRARRRGERVKERKGRGRGKRRMDWGGGWWVVVVVRRDGMDECIVR